MTRASLYLNFAGSSEEALTFYRSVLGGEFLGIMRFRDMPGAPEMSAADAEKVMHMTLPVGDNLMLHASDTLESRGQKLAVGNNFSIMLEPESKAEADRLFSQLSAGGVVEMPMQDMFWGDYYGAFTDRFGVQWMINFANPHSA
ncbi:glyoxalase [Ornatilinea apprima]|uniref:Glyoxalase n=1 Tax=Ornatilinea apprima TaxID=1134406 RepID=A0A0P6X530_9CHLR|nr:VOC family protein [Ornatilinea apprima]KPL76951.1 glyoxalase [Ornatilinea apprima]